MRKLTNQPVTLGGGNSIEVFPAGTPAMILAESALAGVVGNAEASALKSCMQRIAHDSRSGYVYAKIGSHVCCLEKHIFV